MADLSVQRKKLKRIDTKKLSAPLTQICPIHLGHIFVSNYCRQLAYWLVLTITAVLLSFVLVELTTEHVSRHFGFSFRFDLFRLGTFDIGSTLLTFCLPRTIPQYHIKIHLCKEVTAHFNLFVP